MKKEYTFEVYRKRSKASVRSYGAEPVIALGVNGRISFSAAAFELLGSPEWVDLLFDRQTRTIGIRATRDQRHPSDDAFAVRRPVFGGSRFINAKAFISFYDLDFGRTRRLTATMEGLILCVPTRDHDQRA